MNYEMYSFLAMLLVIAKLIVCCRNTVHRQCINNFVVCTDILNTIKSVEEGDKMTKN